MTHDTSTSKALDDYDLLGRSGLRVPQYTFGEQWGYGSNKEEMKKVLYVAISNTPSWELARANAIAELRGWR
ncbi:aldo/keto reductase [Rhizophagus irregularis DAOM 181602=DAOM 197198]|uniref:Uncharacterized protein n=1 Tax=Rhizophagus irregularis (strain DAOM 181602 / DAOM 197198 / MUCL 43194) TaxID=747089 RepID=A0A2P4QVY8_RHIID|nr:hypothetical protein GLOIN_2v1763039 [Rhizophagus irregularis DAOM 181602=DAOM 197198]POG81795.1 hypothetical protein GLOIN_2v1763039 [Rhizophagus irregularis DAOM 181602=DAOM 197198]GET64749.1 aldo/keto reductase [Rhizophagus irregularis DAOM 181602=DAOM 197198]|eukprot:XP_025188661.1 hypothetical protein GLOIN_2v1763039 [Rhizophagus irregularis DAOM 181602=DAOM 197198]